MSTHLFANGSTPSPEPLQLVGASVAVGIVPAGDGVNEDSCGVIELGPKRVLAVVADGMGGGPSGAAASAAALNAVSKAVRRAERNQLPLRSGIIDGFEAAQQQVRELAAGAATTLLVAELQHNQVRLYHAGDSAASVIGRGGKIKFVTDAHSPVGYAVKSGLLDEGDALRHEDRHYVSNLIGATVMSVEVGLPFDLARYDTLVLGSDGLYDNLYLEELAAIVRAGPLVDCATELLHRVRERMLNPAADMPSKLDDLSFVLLRRSE